MLLLLSGLSLAQSVPPDARFALALFCNPDCDDAVLDQLEADLVSIRGRSGFPTRVSKPSRIMGIADSSFEIPDSNFIEVYGVDVDRPEQLAASTEVILAWFASPPDTALATLTTAHHAFAKAAVNSGGWVEDLDTQQVFGAAAWAARSPEGPLEQWFVVDAAPQDANDPDGAVRIVTRGLRRFGLPEVVVENVEVGLAGDVSVVVNAVAEGMKARGGAAITLPIKTEMVDGTATFESVARLEDDPDDPLWRMRFDGQISVPAEEVSGETPAPEEVPAPEEAPAPEEVPAPAPVAVAVPPTVLADASAQPPSPAMEMSPLETAQRQAMARFETVVYAAWQQGLAANSLVAVSVPFPTRDGGTEYMWVEVKTWDGSQLRGVLANEPYNVEGLHKGDEVALKQEEVFDYIWKKADGTREGNTTAQFLKP